jgi:TolA-binding protein
MTVQSTEPPANPLPVVVAPVTPHVVPSPPRSPPRQDSVVSAPSAPSAVAPDEGGTAQSLFAAASRARVGGDRREAIRLSHELITRFPASGEAVTSHLSLGMLYLQDGQPAAALGEFRAYRKVGPKSSMAEPMWGESQALRQLGRTDEERATLEELLLAFPESAYAAAARKRLASAPSP